MYSALIVPYDTYWNRPLIKIEKFRNVKKKRKCRREGNKAGDRKKVSPSLFVSWTKNEMPFTSAVKRDKAQYYIYQGSRNEGRQNFEKHHSMCK